MPTSDPCPVQRDSEVDERHARQNEEYDQKMNDYDGVSEHWQCALFFSIVGSKKPPDGSGGLLKCKALRGDFNRSLRHIERGRGERGDLTM